MKILRYFLLVIILSFCGNFEWSEQPATATNFSLSKPSGMSSEYLKIIEKRLGVPIQRVPNLNWSEVMSGFKQREIDMTTLTRNIMVKWV